MAPALRDWLEYQKEKIKAMKCISINGELCKIDRAYSEKLLFCKMSFWKLNSVWRYKTIATEKRFGNCTSECKQPRTYKPEQRKMLLDALGNLL